MNGLFCMSVMDTLVRQIQLIALVLKPNALHPRTVQGVLLCLFPKNITQIVDCLGDFFLCFFLRRLGENPASVHFQGNPHKMYMEILLLVGWN